MRTVVLLTIALTLSIFAGVFAQDDYIQQIDGIVVTASRSPSAFNDLARSITIIGPSEIEEMPAGSIADLLSGVLSADVRNRGVHGVQADISLRGGTFEQVLILIDGIKVSDPQTGHHNLNLPITRSEIERIEILSGAASKLYGPNAMGGVINIITKKETSRKVHLEASGGEFGLSELAGRVTLPVGAFSTSRKKSNGYIENTEFDILTLSYANSILLGGAGINFSARYMDKEFGAYKFYSDFFPNEWEATEALFLTADANLKAARFSIIPRVSWRRHKDDFILDRERPNWYRNRHTTDQYGFEIQTSFTTSLSAFVFGGEFSREEIKSSSLGDHSRDRGGVFFESRMLLDNKFSVVPGAMLYRYSDYDWKFWPGLDLGYQVTEKIRNYFSVGKAFRVPTYTDLYYVSPANMGNPDLLPEESWTYEYGIRVNDRVITASLTGFIREASNLIDWSRDLNDTTVTFWQVRNISDMTFKGIETGVTIRPNKICECVPVNSVSMQYTYLDSDKSTGEYESKYALDHLKHQATANIRWTWISNISQSLKMRYLDRLSGDEYFVTDTRLTWKYEPVSLFVEITNLFDESYVEIGTVPMPGRWLRVGLKYNAAID